MAMLNNRMVELIKYYFVVSLYIRKLFREIYRYMSRGINLSELSSINFIWIVRSLQMYFLDLAWKTIGDVLRTTIIHLSYQDLVVTI